MNNKNKLIAMFVGVIVFVEIIGLLLVNLMDDDGKYVI